MLRGMERESEGHKDDERHRRENEGYSVIRRIELGECDRGRYLEEKKGVTGKESMKIRTRMRGRYSAPTTHSPHCDPET